MIEYNTDLARIYAECGIPNAEYKNTNFNLEVVLTRGEVSVGDSKIERTPRKKLIVNDVPRRLIDFAGIFKVVLLYVSKNLHTK